MATATTRTRQGDTVDLLASRLYGDTGQTVALLEANPGLADYGPIIPTGTLINVPAAPTKTTQTLTLW